MTRRAYFSAPRVFFEISNEEVIVEDYVSGMWLWELLAAAEQRSPAALERMHELNIDPKIVARRLQWINMWGNLSSVMFHADPHPANVIVQANNRIIFVDFGACGFVSSKKRNLFQEFFRCQALKDVTGMAKAAMAFLEPLPPIDLNAFEKDLERVYFRAACAIWSKKARWWERTTSTLWLNMMELTRQYNLPVNSDTVNSLRATLLYDTLALRLDNDMDVFKESRRFMRDHEHVVGKRMRRGLKKRLLGGLKMGDYAALDDLAKMGGSAVAQVKRLIDSPPFNFSYSIDKPVFVVITGVRVMAFLGTALFAITGGITSYLLLTGKSVSVFPIFWQVLTSRAFQGLTCLAILNGVRRIMFRLNDQDV
jgi:hypothetical protein